MPVGRRHWIAALAAALLIHIAVAVLAMWRAPTSGAAGSGLGGIEVNLGSSGAPSATMTATAQPATEPASEVMPEAAEPVEEVASIEEVAPTEEAPPVAEVEPVETEVPEETPVAEETPPPETLPEPPPETVEVTMTEAAEVEPLETVEAVDERVIPPKPRPKPERPVARTRPEPKKPPPQRPIVERQVTERQPAPKQAAPIPTPPSTTAPAKDPSTRPSPGSASSPAATNSPRTGNTQSTQTAAIGGGIPGASADYLALLRSWLERHKEYPRRAQLRRQEGTALLYFVMDREGRVLEYRLRRSSGYPVLDSEVEEMIQRAQPLPAAPAGFEGARLEFVIPVQFRLR